MQPLQHPCSHGLSSNRTRVPWKFPFAIIKCQSPKRIHYSSQKFVFIKRVDKG